MALAVGSSERLTATVSPSNATNMTVTWTSSNSAIAKVQGQTPDVGTCISKGNSYGIIPRIGGRTAESRAASPYSGDFTYNYAKADGTALSGPPTNAGDYTVTISRRCWR